MKKLDKIIQEEVRSLLTEQAVEKIPFNGKMMTRGQIAVSGLSKTDKHFSPIGSDPNNVTAGIKWPSNIPRKKFPGGVESFFKTIGAVPYTFSNRPMDEKNGYPKFALNIGEETFKFEADGTVYTSSKNDKTNAHSNLGLYWKYVQDPDNPAIRDKSDLNKLLAATGLFQGRKEHTPQLQVYTDKALTKPVFVIGLGSNNRALFSYFSSKKSISDAEAARGQKEAIRGFLDIFGFVPILGDVADLYQAVWYFGDWIHNGRKIDDLVGGLLSLIAVVPIAGSVVKGFLKPVANNLFSKTSWFAIKQANRAKRAAVQNGELLDALQYIFENSRSQLSDEQAKILASAVKQVAKIYASNKPILDNAARTTMPQFLDVLNAIEKQLNTAAGGVDKVLQLTRRAKKVATNLDDPLYKAVKDFSDIKGGTNYLAKLSSLTYTESAKVAAEQTAKALSRLKRAGKIADKYNPFRVISIQTLRASVTNRKATRAIEMINKAFKSGVVNDPDKAVALYQTATGTLKKKILTDILDVIVPAAKDFVDAEIALIKRCAKPDYKGPKLTPGQLAYFQNVCPFLYDPLNKKRFLIRDVDLAMIETYLQLGYVADVSKDMLELLPKHPQLIYGYLNKFAKDKGAWVGAAEKIADDCINEGHAVYNYVIADPIAHLKTMFPESGKDVWKLFTDNVRDGKKWLDIYYQFLHELYSDMVYPDEEHRRSYAYTALKDSIKANTPQWSQDFITWANKFLQLQKQNIEMPHDAKSSYEVKDIPRDSTTILAPISGTGAVTPRGKALKSNPFLKTL